jgi:hypothetical protein
VDWLLLEMLQEVREYASQQGFAALCLASRPIYNVGNNILYESIRLNLNDNVNCRVLYILQRSLTERPNLTRKVRRALFSRQSDPEPSRNDKRATTF